MTGTKKALVLAKTYLEVVVVIPREPSCWSVRIPLTEREYQCNCTRSGSRCGRRARREYAFA